MFTLIRLLSPRARRIVLYVFLTMGMALAVLVMATGNVSGGLGLAAFFSVLVAVFELGLWLARREPLWARRPDLGAPPRR